MLENLYDGRNGVRRAIGEWLRQPVRARAEDLLAPKALDQHLSGRRIGSTRCGPSYNSRHGTGRNHQRKFYAVYLTRWAQNASPYP